MPGAMALLGVAMVSPTLAGQYMAARCRETKAIKYPDLTSRGASIQ